MSKKPTTASKYAKKRRSGAMMYGPTPSAPKYPEFRAKYVPRNEYWWGELRLARSTALELED